MPPNRSTFVDDGRCNPGCGVIVEGVSKRSIIELTLDFGGGDVVCPVGDEMEEPPRISARRSALF